MNPANQALSPEEACDESCVHTVFEQQVARTPAAVALRLPPDAARNGRPRQLSYRELDRRANQLAHHLSGLGVGPEVIVGLCVGPSLERIVGLLGILKAGGACLPLEPHDPPQHLAAQLQGARAKVILSTERWLPELGPAAPLAVLADRDGAVIDALPEHPPCPEVSPGNLAWMVRTAGRRVMLEHRSLHSRALGWRHELAPAADDVVLHQALAGTSAELGNLLRILLHGGCVVLGGPWQGEELRRKVRELGITVLALTPQELATCSAAGARLRLILISGSPQKRYAMESTGEEPGSEPIVCHLYDPPEAGAEIGHDAGHGALGEGIWIELLDRFHALVPAGMAGEVHVSGDALARGYLGDPRATAERFVPDPFAELPGERLFKSGDLGRRDDDGTLDWLGPIGRQAWVGGQRIDPAEVEAMLSSHPLVEDCAVLVREDSAGGGPEMVAYLVLRKPLDPARRRALLEEVLPPGCRPRATVPVTALPLDAEGRVDRETLAQAEIVDATLAASWEEALTALPEIEEAAVVPRESIASLPALPLAELVADWRRLTAESPLTSPTPPPAPVPGEGSPARRPAISHGEPLMRDAADPAVLSEALRAAAERFPDRGITVHRDETSESFLSYRELLDEAQRLLAGLRRLGAEAGDKVIFQLPGGEEFLTAFWACQLGGMVPVPISIPTTYEEDTGDTRKLRNAWKLLDQPLIVAGQELVTGIRALFARAEQAPAQVVGFEDPERSEADPPWHAGRPQDVAILFLTSGSTGVPKGVPQTHAALLSMVAGTCQMNGFSDRDVTLNWMPLDHVGALVFLHLMSVRLGCPQVHAPTPTILQQPLLWLDWIDRHRSTISWAPNFAFALINDRAEEITRRRWDLSSMRFLVNAGESVSVPTVRRFLRLLAQHGLPDLALRPAFGMSETCSGITWSRGFSLHASTDDQRFVELGRPIPGAALRIVDAEDRIVEEGTVGRLQLRGPSVMDGYHHHPEANREAFTADGWFTSGDLGLVDDGRLVITGREKDVIIVHGVNYYCHEIEAAVEELEAIDVSYTAACAVRRAGADTDQLAVFFSSPTTGARLAELLAQVRARLVEKTGLAPDILIPVDREQIPKTAIGKIQRAQLSRSLAEGAFDQRLEELDQLTGKVTTLPAWFFRRTWRRRQPAATFRPDGSFLVLLDRLGLGEALCAALNRRAASVIAVEPGADFVRLGADRYRIDLGEAAHYRQLIASVEQAGVRVGHVVHLGSYQEHPGEIAGPDDLERGREQGLYSLLFLAQALAGAAPPGDPAAGQRRLSVISTFTQAVTPHDPIAPEKSPLLGLLPTIEQELDGWSCRHLDLETAPPDANARRVLAELSTPGVDREVCYRAGKRWVCRLEPVHPGREPQAPPVWQTGGAYLLSGGLGGIGLELARLLLGRYRARVLLVDKIPLPDPDAEVPDEEIAARFEAYRDLQSLPGEVAYEAVDVADPGALRSAVERVTARWQDRLDGVVHLAGIARECLLADETREGLAATLRPKVTGAWALHQLIADRPEAIFLSFSSVNGFFGGATVGAYAAANRFLDEFAHYLRARGFSRGYSLAWSLWEETGMSRGYAMKELAMARGYLPVGLREGICSLLAATATRDPVMLIGLDAGKRGIHRLLADGSRALERPVAYYTSGPQKPSAAQLRGLLVRDRYGRASSCEFVPLQEVPRTSSGEIDRQALTRRDPERADAGPAAPQTREERLLVEVWQQVLGKREVGIHDNFFAIGGDSILAIQVIARANQAGLSVAPQDVVRHQTIAELARNLSPARSREPEDEALAGPFPLSTEQCWFFELRSPNLHHHNQDLLLELRQEPEPAHLEQILRRLLEHHDALRLRFTQQGPTWHQAFADAGDLGDIFAHVDLSRLAEPDRGRTLAAVGDAVHDSLNLFDGPLLRAVLLTRGAKLPSRLLIVVHHLAIDGVSWRILAEDFHTAWEQRRRGEAIILPAKTASFKRFCEALDGYARSEQVRADLGYWQQRAQLPVAPLPVDHPDGENTVGWLRMTAAELEPEATRALVEEIPGRLGVRINEILLTALAQAFRDWTGSSRLWTYLIAHGRQPPLANLDLSRTVGWCSFRFPVLLDLETSGDPYAELCAIRDQLRRIPGDGLSYALARYRSGDERLVAALDALARPEVLFNYFGQYDPQARESPLFRMSQEPRGQPSARRMRRAQLLAVNTQVLGGVLELSISYSEKLHRPETMERLAAGYAAALDRLSRCVAPGP